VRSFSNPVPLGVLLTTALSFSIPNSRLAARALFLLPLKDFVVRRKFPSHVRISSTPTELLDRLPPLLIVIGSRLGLLPGPTVPHDSRPPFALHHFPLFFQSAFIYPRGIFIPLFLRIYGGARGRILKRRPVRKKSSRHHPLILHKNHNPPIHGGDSAATPE